MSMIIRLKVSRERGLPGLDKIWSCDQVGAEVEVLAARAAKKETQNP